MHRLEASKNVPQFSHYNRNWQFEPIFRDHFYDLTLGHLDSRLQEVLDPRRLIEHSIPCRSSCGFTPNRPLPGVL